MTSEDHNHISSLQNPRIKNAVKLRQRSHRDDSGQMLIEGAREITLALENGHIPLEIYYCTTLLKNDEQKKLLDQCIALKITPFECSIPVFEKISYRENPGGLLAVAPVISNGLESFSPPEQALVIVAESIEKPGNLGSILRTADAAGAHAVIVCDHCTDINNPNVVRASLGTIFALPVIESSSEEALSWLKKNNLQTIAAVPDAELKYTSADLSAATAIIVGSEQSGLSRIWLDNTDLQVGIPMLGQADSLNVSVSTAILVYETLRQRSV